jgi:hypothetical protein
MSEQVGVTLKEVLPLISVVIGVVIGGVSTFFNNFYLERKRIIAERRNLAQAFSGEVAALLRIVEMRRYVEWVQQAIKYMRFTGQPYHLSIQVRQPYFNVYEQNASRIGILEGPLPSMIATFYT